MPIIRQIVPNDPERTELWGNAYPATVIFCAQCGDDYTCLHDPHEHTPRSVLRDTASGAAEMRGWVNREGRWYCRDHAPQ